MAHWRSGMTITVIGVYLPFPDLGINFYCTCLTKLEELVIESKHLGPTVVIGEFIAHLGSLGSPRGRGNTYAQGYHLHQNFIKCNIIVASQLESAYCPPYTFQRGDTQTTIDYIMMDVGAASLRSCGTLDIDE